MKRKWISIAALCLLPMIYVGCQPTQSGDLYGLADKAHAAVTPADRSNVDWWMPRHEQVLHRVAQGDVNLIFVGDSITQGWENAGKAIWDRYYAPRNAVNMGFGGDRTQHVLWRFDHGEIDGISPKLAVLMIGTNNSNGQDHTAEEIADGIKAICARIQAKLPKTKILMLAIFPRGDAVQRKVKEQGATFNSQWANNARASELAARIADNRRIYYLDINDAFLDENGVLTREVMPDLLHPKEKGYTIWAETIEPTVKKLMGEK
jgi:beta-glucosidase